MSLNEMILDKYYTLKVWLCTLSLAPIIFVFITLIKVKNFDPDSILFMFFMFGYSLVYSFPAFLIYHLIFHFFTSKFNDKNKFILSLILYLLMFLTVFIVFGKTSFNFDANFSGVTFSIIYFISILISSFYFKIFKSAKSARK